MVDKNFIRQCIEESLNEALRADNLSVYDNITEADCEFIKEHIEMTPEVEYWIQEMVEFEALMNDEIVEEARKTSNSTAQKGVAIGTAIGAIAGGATAGLGGAVLGASAGGVAGAVAGGAVAAGKALLGKGGQRVLADQIDRGNKKLQKWKSEPQGAQKNKDKIEKMNKKIQNWKAELAEMKRTGSGKSGLLRSSAEKAETRREAKK